MHSLLVDPFRDTTIPPLFILYWTMLDICWEIKKRVRRDGIQNGLWWIHNLRQASWSTDPHAALPCEALKHHLTALTCHSCAHTTNSHRLVDSGALNQAYNNEGTWGIIAADLQSSATAWFCSLYACLHTGEEGGVLGKVDTPSCIWRPVEPHAKPIRKGWKRGLILFSEDSLTTHARV